MCSECVPPDSGREGLVRVHHACTVSFLPLVQLHGKMCACSLLYRSHRRRNRGCSGCCSTPTFLTKTLRCFCAQIYSLVPVKTSGSPCPSPFFAHACLLAGSAPQLQIIFLHLWIITDSHLLSVNGYILYTKWKAVETVGECLP